MTSVGKCSRQRGEDDVRARHHASFPAKLALFAQAAVPPGAPGEVLFRRGELGLGTFIVESGQVRLGSVTACRTS